MIEIYNFGEKKCKIYKKLFIYTVQEYICSKKTKFYVCELLKI